MVLFLASGAAVDVRCPKFVPSDHVSLTLTKSREVIGMDAYDDLLDEASRHDVDVYERYKMKSPRIKGFYVDDTVLLSSQIRSRREGSDILAEELGHYYTSAGDITDPQSMDARRQELRARLWAYNHRIGLRGIISSVNRGCSSLYEMAEYLGVTDKFLADALEAYHHKYGQYVEIDNYVVFFEPKLSVLKIL